MTDIGPDDNIFDLVNGAGAQASLGASWKLNPEAEARKQALARTVGVPTVVADRQFDVLDRQVKDQRARDALVGAPQTQAALAEPDFAAVAHDQVDHLSTLERGLGVLKNVGLAAYSGFPRLSAQIVGAARMVNDVSHALDPFQMLEPAESKKSREAGDAWAAGYQARLNADANRIMPKSDNVLAAAAYSGISSIPASLGAAAATATGGPVAGAAMLAGPTAGGAYGEARDKNIPIPRAIGYAASQGMIEWATEKLPVAALLGDVKAGSGFLKTLGKQLLLEIPGEQVATILQDFNDWAVLNPDKPFTSYLAERPSAALQTAVATVVAAGGQVIGAKGFDRVAQEASHRLGQARVAQQQAQTFDAVAEAIAASPLRTRSPERFNELLAAMAPDADVLLPAEEVQNFLQARMTPDEQTAFLDATGLAEQMTAAVPARGDVVMSAGDYLAHVAPTEAHAAFRDHLRLGADAMSLSEAQAFDEHYQSFIEERGAALSDDARATSEAAAPAQRVFDDVFAQHRAAGYTNDASRQVAALIAAHTETFGQMQGRDAWAEYQTMPLTVSREMPGELKARIDRIDHVIDTLRRGSKKAAQGPSLLDFISRNGGMRDDGGEFGAMDVETWHKAKPFRSRVVREDGLSPDEMAERAQDAGYFQAVDQRQTEDGAADSVTTADRLREAVRRELAGQRVTAAPLDMRDQSFRSAVDQLDQILGEMGIDVGKATNAEIKGALEAFAQDQAGERFEQADLPDLTDEDVLARVAAAGVEGVTVEGRGPMGPVLGGLEGRWSDAVKALSALETGEARAVLKHPGVPEPIDIPWDAGGKGLSSIIHAHGEVIDDLPSRLADMQVLSTSANRIRLGSATSKAVVRLDFDGASKTWLITAYEVSGRRGADTTASDPNLPDQAGKSPDGPADANIAGDPRRFNQFAGQGAETANRFALERAESMAAAGIKDERIRQDTGWFKGDDGRWRFEISDRGAKLRARLPESGVLRDYLDHDRLYAAYPEIAEIPTTLEEMDGATGAVEIGEDGSVSIFLAKGGLLNRGEQLQTLLHEVQHVIQEREGFAVGGDPAQLSERMEGDPTFRSRVLDVLGADLSPAARERVESGKSRIEDEVGRFTPAQVKAYRQLSGEVEARNTERRRRFSDAKRAKVSPLATRDVPPDRAIVVFDDGTEATSRRLSSPVSADQTYRQFAGVMAVTAPREAFNRAMALEREGALPGVIEDETGWRRGDEGSWRFEISDDKADFKSTALRQLFAQRALAPENRKPLRLGDLLNHPDLFAAYPSIGDIEVRVRRMDNKGAISPDGGMFVSDDMVGRALTEGNAGREALISTVLHEVQHAIQFFEGHAVGAPTRMGALLSLGYGPEITAEDERLASGAFDGDDYSRAQVAAFNVYRRSAGEVEARNTQTRRPMTAQGRRDLPGDYTRDVPRAEAIVRLTVRGESLDTSIDGLTLQQQARGDITFTEARAFIRYFRGANLSTPIHETGHFLLERLRLAAQGENTSPQIVEMWAAARKWLGNDGGTLTVDQHEQWARGFEAYALEGKAPSAELRSVFQRFKSWLMNIYRSVRALNVELDPQVRDVFDRMLASDDAIRRYRDQQALNPIFGSPGDAGMTQAEYDAYTKAVTASNGEADDGLFQRLLKDVRRRETKAWAAERSTLRDEAAAAVDQRPDVRAYHWLTRGELLGADDQPGRVSLDRDAVVAVYGTDTALARLPKSVPPVYVAAGGAHPDIIAEHLGYRSGEAMLDDVMALEEFRRQRRANGDNRSVRKALAEDMADAEMLSRHGDALNDGSIEEEALAALHNDSRQRLVSTEVRALGKKAGEAMPQWTDEAMTHWATQTVARLKVSQVRPEVYLRAERQAGAEAQRHLLAGDTLRALERKRQQLLNFHLYRAAKAAADDVTEAETLFDRIVKAKNDTVAKARNADMVEAARLVLAAHGVGRARHDPAAYMEAVKTYDPDLYADLEPAVAAALADGRQVKDLTFEEFAGLRDTVDQLWTMSRRSKVIEIDGKRVALADAAGALTSRLGELGLPDAKFGDRAPSPADKTVRKLSGMRAGLRRVEHWIEYMDAGAKGVFRTYIWNPISEAADRYRADQVVYRQKFLDLVQGVETSLKRGKIEAGELGYTFGHANGGVGKGELLHAILHTGNESNKAKLLLGRGWAVEREDGTLDTSRWDGFVSRMHVQGVLTKADYDFAQGVWDLLEEMKPAAQKAHRAVFGRYFSEVTADEVQTPFGAYRGGYVPALTDDFLVQDAALRAEQDIVGAGNATMFPSPARGFTKSRVEAYTKPLALDLGLLPRHIDKVLLFSHMTAPVRDVLRLLKEKDVSAQLQARDPVAQTDMLLPWLNRAAKQIVETPMQGHGGRAVEGALRALRTRTGANIMVGNVSNALQQVTGLSVSATRVKPGQLAGGLAQFVLNRKAITEEVISASPFMAGRMTAAAHEISANIDDLLLDPTKYQKVREFAQKHAYVLQQQTQGMVDLVTWRGSYNQAVEAGESEVEAVRRADAAVRLTQGSLSPEDISKAESGTALTRALLQFYSFFNNQANLLGSEYGSIVREMGWKGVLSPRSISFFMLAAYVPAVVTKLIVKTMAGDWDDEDGYLDDWLDVLLGGPASYFAGMVPLLGPTAVLVAGRFNDKPYDDRLNVSPVVSTLEAVAGTPYDAYRVATTGKGQKALVKDSLTLTSLLTGVPLGFLARPLGYLADVNEGKVQPTGPVDFGRGLVSGTASAESRTQ